MQNRNDLDLDVFRKKLKKRRKELEAMLEESKHEVEPVSIDESQVGLLSRLEAIEEKAVSEEVDHKREGELKRIGMALKRMDDGEYGYCLSCGDEIDKKRLELDPSALACVECAKV